MPCSKDMGVNKLTTSMRRSCTDWNSRPRKSRPVSCSTIGPTLAADLPYHQASNGLSRLMVPFLESLTKSIRSRSPSS